MPITPGSRVHLPAFTLDGGQKDWNGVPIKAGEAEIVPVCWLKAGLEAQSFNPFTIHFAPESYDGLVQSLLKTPRNVLIEADPALADAIASRLRDFYPQRAQELGIIVASCLGTGFLAAPFLHRSSDPLDFAAPEEYDGGEMIAFLQTGIPTDVITSGSFDYTLTEDDVCAGTSDSNDFTITDFLFEYVPNPGSVSDNIDLYKAAAERFSKIEAWQYSVPPEPQVDSTVVTNITTCFGDPVSETTTVYKTAQTKIDEVAQAAAANTAAIHALGIASLDSLGQLGGSDTDPDYEPLIQKVIAFFGL